MLLRSVTPRDLDQLTARVSESTGRSGARLAAYRIDHHFYVDIDLPGVNPADVDVTVDQTALTVRAERRDPSADHATPSSADPADHRRASGPASCQVALAEALDTDRIDARYENGVLVLRIPVRAA